MIASHAKPHRKKDQSSSQMNLEVSPLNYPGQLEDSNEISPEHILINSISDLFKTNQLDKTYRSIIDHSTR